MSKERLGAFEKFILTHAYLKAMGIYPKPPHEFHSDKLYKTEILRSYFPNLKSSSKGMFQDTLEYRSALAQLNTAVNNLERKRLVKLWVKAEEETIEAVTLNEKGVEKARAILLENNK